MNLSKFLVTLTDLAFGGLIGWSIFALLYLRGFFDIRIVLIPGGYGPEAYKVILWSLFSLVVLRPRFRAKYLMAFAFTYCLAEDIGNWTYILVHWSLFSNAFGTNFWNPFPQSDPNLVYKYIIFNLTPVFSFLFLKDKLRFNPVGFVPFAILIGSWLAIGYPLQTDYATPASIPVAVFLFDGIWSVFYILGWVMSYRVPMFPRAGALSRSPS